MWEALLEQPLDLRHAQFCKVVWVAPELLSRMFETQHQPDRKAGSSDEEPDYSQTATFFSIGKNTTVGCQDPIERRRLHHPLATPLWTSQSMVVHFCCEGQCFPSPELQVSRRCWNSRSRLECSNCQNSAVVSFKASLHGVRFSLVFARWS